ncbi:MAG: DNA adenine methylase [Bacteroidetes bacterium]|nr:MAG: DNA adenine methylase [Bacteroidota bacterium]
MKSAKVKPFLKWAGGKSQLLEQLQHYLPTTLKKGNIKTYVEPFLGGGSVFFALSQQFKFEKVYLSDINKDLVLTYQVVQQHLEALLELLTTYQTTYNQTPQAERNKLYLSVRELFNQQRFGINYNEIGEKEIERASHFIFLNKTCFNGLFRLNAKGGFNVPYGKYKKASILDEANLRAVSRSLQNVEIVHGDYSACLDKVDAQSFVYFDPPYRPISSTANFTTYTGKKFGDEEQTQLAQFFRSLDKDKGAMLMLSNSDPTHENPQDTFFQEIYEGYKFMKVSAGRAINCDGKKRGKITELLILNYNYGL